MENYTPDRFRSRGLTLDGYLTIFTGLLRAVPFTAVSLTGGEPLANHHLPEIAQAVRPLVNRLELNTNGLLLTEARWQKLQPYFDRVKISLDTLDSDLFQTMTRAAVKNPLEKVVKAVKIVRDSGVEVAVNCVVTKFNYHTLSQVIDWAAEEGVRLHLLDFYYTDERRPVFQQGFIPIESIMPRLTAEYGEPSLQPVFGCHFYTYSPKGKQGVVRLKTSFSGTMRSDRCTRCPRYCQEGLYGLKLSTDGWVTTCPSNEEEDGALLEPTMSPEMIRQQLSWLLAELESRTFVPDSFERFLHANNLDISANSQPLSMQEAHDPHDA